MSRNPMPTPAEAKVLRLLVSGHTNESIARQLGIHPNTVRARIKVLCEKAGIEPDLAMNRRVRLAVRTALVERVPLAAELGYAVGLREQGS